MYNASESRYEKMKYIRSGKSGLRLPAISLGLWHNFGSYCNIENMKSVCYAAFDNGVVHFDLANNSVRSPEVPRRISAVYSRMDWLRTVTSP